MEKVHFLNKKINLLKKATKKYIYKKQLTGIINFNYYFLIY